MKSESDKARRRTVLCVSGLDPSGGAGLQADIEAVQAQGAHALGIVTALTVQNTINSRSVTAVAAELISEQIAALREDLQIDAIKLGLLGNRAQVELLARIAGELDCPLVLDPVLIAGGGAELAGEAVASALRQLLIPRATVITPNLYEARRLCRSDDKAEACATQLLAAGAQAVLITGGDLADQQVRNYWQARQGPGHWFEYTRLHGQFHGSGCTLAAALAARLALGEALRTAAQQAQDYCATTLAAAFRPGRGQLIPNRRPQ